MASKGQEHNWLENGCVSTEKEISCVDIFLLAKQQLFEIWWETRSKKNLFIKKSSSPSYNTFTEEHIL